MADNIEKKILIEATVLDNFLAAKKNVDQWKKSLKDAEADESKTAEELREIAQNLAVANNQYKDARRNLEAAAKSQEIFNAASEKTNKSLGEMQRELSALRNTPFEGLDDKQIAEINQQIADLTAGIQDYRLELKGLNTGEIHANIAQGLQTITAGTSALTSTLTVLGVESETFDRLQKSTVELIAITQALGVVTDYLSKKKYALIAANVKNIITTTKETVAQKLQTAQTNKQTGATIKYTVAQWALNAATNAFPVLAIVAGLILFINNLEKLRSYLNGGAQAQRELTKATKDYEDQVIRTQQTIDTIQAKNNSDMDYRKLKMREELAQLKKDGASKEEISKRELELSNQVTDIEIEGIRKVNKERENEWIALNKVIKSQEKNLKNANLSKKEYKKLNDELEANKTKYTQLSSEIQINAYKALNLIEDQDKANEDFQDKKLEKDYKTSLELLNQQKRFGELSIKAEDDYQSDNFAKRQQYQERLYSSNENFQKKQLGLQKKYGKITNSEYQGRLKEIELSRQEFNNSQAKASESYFNEQMNQILSMADKNTEEQIQAVQEKYQSAFDNINVLKLTADENQYKDLALARIRLEEQLQKEIDAINEKSLAKRLSDIEKLYKNDLAKYTDNEREKNEIAYDIEKNRQNELAKLLRDGKITQEQYNTEYYESEARLRELNFQQSQLNLSRDLILAKDNAKKKYEARKTALEAELEIYKDNADKQIEINALLKENQKEYWEEMIAEVEKYAEAIMGIFSAINDFRSAGEDAQLQKSEETNEKEKENLKQRYEQGIISKTEYDKQVEASDKKLEKEQKRIARERAVREKNMNLFEATINTARAIAAALPNIPLSILAGATGAVQIAAIASQPLPKARKGMLLNGPSHAQGGIPIEAEGGEIILTKGVYQNPMLRTIASMINQAGGGVPFVNTRGDGGYTYRTTINNNNGISEKAMTRALQNAFREINIYTAVEDINEAENDYTLITDRGIV